MKIKGEMIEMKKQKETKEILDELRDVESVTVVAIATKDGLPLLQKQKVETLSAMSAVALDIAETMSTIVLGRRLPDRVMESEYTATIESPYGKIFVIGVSPEMLLTVITEPEANIQLVSMEMLRAAKRIKELME